MNKMQLEKTEISHKINAFLLEHPQDYTKQERDFILANATWGNHSLFVLDLLCQIYDYLGVIENQHNIYLGFLELVKKHFNINQNIIECGGGRIPCLAKYLALENHKGTVTVYDPKLITTTTKIPNLILKKENLTLDTNIKNTQLIIGFMPCEATSMLIELACKNHIDFMIALCEGHVETDNWDDIYDWEARMVNEARTQINKHNLGTLAFESLEEYDNPYPVIYNKRR